MKRWFILFLLLSSCTQTVKAPLQVQVQNPDDHGFMYLGDVQRKVRWAPEDMPLVLMLDPSAILWTGHVEVAVRTWNQRLGANFFLLQKDLHQEAAVYKDNAPGVVPIFGFTPDASCESLPSTTPECTFHTDVRYWHGTGRIFAAPVYLPMEGFLYPDAYWLVVHELGHSMGLDHDVQSSGQKENWSVMEPMLFVPWRDHPPAISQADVDRLKAWYLQESRTNE